MRDGLNIRSVDLKTRIHPTAIVHPWAKLGEGTTVGPYSVIGEHVVLGEGCEVGAHCFIEGRTTIGRNNRFFHGATVGTAPQDFKYNDQVSHLEIGDNNTFREYITLNRATGEGERTVIGSGCFLMAYVHVAHNCILGNEVTLANSVNLAGHVTLDDCSTIGGVTPVHQYVRMGKYAFVGGGSRIERDIPPFIKAAGNPARVYGVNSIGLERRGFSHEKRVMIRNIFKILYRSDLNVSQVLELLRNGDFHDPERQIMVEFLESSERGITK
jgi:UDP-N-acetylglucosamine acyltransferase